LNRAAKASSWSRLRVTSCSKDEPAHILRAGRGSQRADVGPVALVGRQQAAGIDHFSHLFRVPGLGGQVGPEGGQHGIGRGGSVFGEADGDHGLLAVGALVHQVDVHVRELALDGFLGGMVEVELDEVIAHAAGNDVAAGVHVDDDGVAVVLQRDGAADVMELDGLQGLVQARAANVDGRLLVPTEQAL
jgi:hypothetical protein